MSAKGLLSLVLLSLVVCYATAHTGGYTPSHFPGLMPGFGNRFYSNRPTAGYIGCKYWCKSNYSSQYYCCSNVGRGGSFGGNGGSFGGNGGLLNGGFGNTHGINNNRRFGSGYNNRRW